jgi:hypothetical protein
MSNENKVNVNLSSSLMFVLGTILLILKLAEVINWSWWIVLIPFYPLFLVIFLLIVWGILYGIIKLEQKRKK